MHSCVISGKKQEYDGVRPYCDIMKVVNLQNNNFYMMIIIFNRGHRFWEFLKEPCIYTVNSNK